jgi:small GTP-binding protein
VSRPSFKIVLLGDSGVGKSAIARRQCYDEFQIRMVSTMGASHFRTTVPAAGEPVDLRVWDTGGQEQFAPLVPVYVRQAHAAIIVASVVESVSIQNIDTWKERLQATEPRALVVVAINKMDLASPGDGDRIREELGSSFEHIIFVSAKTGDGIGDMFKLIAEHVIRIDVVEDAGHLVEAGGQKAGCC